MFLPRQLLSTIFGFLFAACLMVPGNGRAQVVGNDVVVLKSPAPNRPGEILQGVLITGMKGSRIMVTNASGEIGYDVLQVASVMKSPPPEFAQAQQAIDAGNLEAALPLLKQITDKYKGLPTVWAQDATSMLASVYMGVGKYNEAELAYSDLERSYSATAATVAKVGKARVAAARKNFTDARSYASSVVSGAMTKKNLSRQESQLFGQAYFVLGQVAEADNKLPEAMEDYCRVVAIFYHDPTVVKEAQKRIDDLRSKKVTTP